MGVNWTNCPKCSGPLSRSSKILDGATVIGCRACKCFQIEGDIWMEQGTMGHGQVMDMLRARHEMVKRQSDEERTKQVMETPIDDPRWETLG